MKQEVTLSNREDSLLEDGMLFVRTKGILTTMVRLPIIIIGLMVVAITIPAQFSLGSTKSLDLTIYSDGSTHVNSEISVNPLDPDYSVELFGTEIDNFVAEDENGFFLSSEIQGDVVVVETLGASTLIIDYDTHDLISKQGRTWSFNIDSPIDYNLLMPKNIVIVGMSNYPLSMQITDDKSLLLLPSGPLELNYFFGVSTTPNPTPPTTETSFDNSLLYLGGGISAAAIIAVLLIKRSKQVIRKAQVKSTAQLEIDEKPLDTETIFKLRPELREDDKEIVNFISANGGQAFESELRKKFLQPRTTMWRAVKRLERLGIRRL